MLAHVGQRLLQNEQYLKLLVGVQRCTISVIQVQLHVQPGLPAEAPDRVIHRLAQRLLAQPGPEILQQLAHILVALGNPRLQQRHDLLHLIPAALLHRAAQHLRLQVQEVQPLGQAVMQPLCHQIALLGHGQLACLDAQPLVVQRRPQVLPQHLQQLKLAGRHRRALTEMQRKGAQRRLRRHDLEDRHRLETITHAADLLGARQLAEVPDDHRAALRGLAAEAGIGSHAVLAFLKCRRKPQRHDNVQPLPRRIQHPDAACRRMELVHHPLQEAPAQRLDVVGLVQERRHAVERAQLPVLPFQLGRLLTHMLAQVLVQALQLVRHPVEALGQHAQFVGIVDGHPHREVPGRHPLDTALQRLHRPDDPAVQQEDHRHRAQAGHHDQHALQDPQPGCLAGVADLQYVHQPIGLGHEARQLRQIGRAVPLHQRLVGQIRQLIPAGRHGMELLAQRRIGGQEERSARKVPRKMRQDAALLPQVHHHLGLSRLIVPEQVQPDTVRAHPQAARLVDGSCRARQLPRQPQRPAHHAQHQRQRHHGTDDDAGGQPVLPGRRSRLGLHRACHLPPLRQTVSAFLALRPGLAIRHGRDAIRYPFFF